VLNKEKIESNLHLLLGTPVGQEELTPVVRTKKDKYDTLT